MNKKVNHNIIISRKDLPDVRETILSEAQKREIEKSVKRTIKEYGETLKLLGRN